MQSIIILMCCHVLMSHSLNITSELIQGCSVIFKVYEHFAVWNRCTSLVPVTVSLSHNMYAVVAYQNWHITTCHVCALEFHNPSNPSWVTHRGQRRSFSFCVAVCLISCYNWVCVWGWGDQALWNGVQRESTVQPKGLYYARLEIECWSWQSKFGRTGGRQGEGKKAKHGLEKIKLSGPAAILRQHIHAWPVPHFMLQRKPF